MSISIPGTLNVIERQGRKGAFMVAELQTEIGSFDLKHQYWNNSVRVLMRVFLSLPAFSIRPSAGKTAPGPSSAPIWIGKH